MGRQPAGLRLPDAVCPLLQGTKCPQAGPRSRGLGPRRCRVPMEDVTVGSWEPWVGEQRMLRVRETPGRWGNGWRVPLAEDQI